MKKIKLVLSDFHIAKGRILEDGSTNLLEDFTQDAEFIDFLGYYSTDDYRKTDVELIFNGDFLNTLQVDYREQYPTYITEEVALEKLGAIIAGHSLLFEALKEYVQTPNHSLTIIPGNHDPAFIWPAVRGAFSSYLEAEVRYPMPVYNFDGFHIEHGNQHSAVNAYEPKQFFLQEGLPEPILNLPWGSHFIIEYLNRIKLKRNIVDKVRPFGRYLLLTLIGDPLFGWWAVLTLFFFILRTRFVPSRLRETDISKTWQMLKEGFRLVPDLENAARNILNKPDIHTVIMGHSHSYKYRLYKGDKEYFNTGTWNDMVFIQLKNLGLHTRLTFVQIEYPNDSRPRAKLMEWRGMRSPVAHIMY